MQIQHSSLGILIVVISDSPYAISVSKTFFLSQVRNYLVSEDLEIRLNSPSISDHNFLIEGSVRGRRDNRLAYIFKSVIDPGVNKVLPKTDLDILRMVKAYGPKITELKSKILVDKTPFKISQHYSRDVNLNTFNASEIYMCQD